MVYQFTLHTKENMTSQYKKQIEFWDIDEFVIQSDNFITIQYNHVDGKHK